MSLTKNQIDLFIEREAEKASYPPYFIEAAQLLAPLLLRALSALHEAVEHTSSNLEDMEHYFDNKCCPTMDELNQVVIANSNLRMAIGQIEAAVLNTVKGGAK